MGMTIAGSSGVASDTAGAAAGSSLDAAAAAQTATVEALFSSIGLGAQVNSAA